MAAFRFFAVWHTVWKISHKCVQHLCLCVTQSVQLFSVRHTRMRIYHISKRWCVCRATPYWLRSAFSPCDTRCEKYHTIAFSICVCAPHRAFSFSRCDTPEWEFITPAKAGLCSMVNWVTTELALLDNFAYIFFHVFFVWLAHTDNTEPRKSFKSLTRAIKTNTFTNA